MKPSEFLIALALVPAGAALAWWLLTEAVFAMWTLIWPRLFTYGRLNFNGWMAVAGLASVVLIVLAFTLRHLGA
jgi:hypothetical protein